jgi:polar amino acid transport system permease protein
MSTVSYLRTLVSAIPTTLALTGVSFGIGLLGGLPLMLMRRSRARLLRGVATAFIDVARGVPVIAWLFLIYFGLAESVVKFSAFGASVLALGLLMSGVMAEIYRSGVMAIDRGQWEAGRAIGLPEWRLYLDVVGPQAVRVCVPPSASALLSLLKDTAVASTVGVADITYRATTETRMTYVHGLTIFGMAALLYVALSLPIAVLSRRLDRSLRRGFTPA